MPPAPASRVVGRRPELAALHAALDDARRGRGGLVLLSGDPGIGKTALLESVMESVVPTAARAYWGQCWEGGGAPAYWPWRQVLASCIAEMDDDTLAEHFRAAAPDVAVLVPELYHRLPTLDPAPPADSRDARVRLFDAVSHFLLDVGDDTGLVLVLDDLHAADEASLRLLARVGSRLPDSKVLVVGAYRDADVQASPAVTRLITAVAAHGRVMPLGGLGEPEVGELLRQSGAAPAGDLVRRLHRSTDGNPFVVLESARLLDTGAGREEDRSPLPEDVNGLVRRRLDSLGHSTREVLTYASALGRDFELDVLHRATGLPVEDLLDELARAATAGIVEERRLGRWSFAHALLRERLYEDVPAAKRASLHGGLGEAVEELQARDEESRDAELAHHYSLSRAPGHADRAVRYCEAAGRHALAASAFEDATGFFRRGLDALGRSEHPDDERRYDLLLLLGEASARSGDFSGARETYRRAIKAARAVRSPERLAAAALGFAGEVDPAAAEETVPVLEEALSALGPDNSGVRAKLLLSLAGTLHRRWPDAHLETARELSAQALEMARRLGDPATLRAVLRAWHLNALFFGPETLAERLAVADELIARADASGDLRLLAQGRIWRAADLFEAGDPSAMATELDLASDLARQLREPFLVWGATFPRAALALLGGRFDEAEEHARMALAIGERTEFTNVETMFSGQMFEIRLLQGRPDELETRTRRAAERFPRPSARVYLALLLAHLGREDEARRQYEAVFDDIVAGRYGIWGLLARAVLADVCWLLGDGEGAAVIYERLRPYSGCHVVNGVAGASNGSADRHLGCLATLLGRFDEAEDHFERAHRLHERMGAWPWLAHGQAAHARMSLTRRRPGDEARAASLLEVARNAYRTMGMHLYEQRVTAVLAGVHVGERGTFRRDGQEWVLEYRGERARLADSKGLHYLAALLREPGRERSSVDLARASAAEAERARQSVARSVRRAIERISEAHPGLGAHLASTVHTGTVSSYMPERRTPIVWDVAEPP